MSAEGNLEPLLAAMSPRRRPGEYVFVVMDDRRPVPDAAVQACVVEPEGVTLVLDRPSADRAGLVYDFIAGWITLQVHSALNAIGLTAAVSTALADADISCNVIAGFHHDHLLVPYGRVADALDVLHGLSARHRAPRPTVTVRPARADDARAMTDLARAAYAPYVARIGREPAPMTADYTAIADAGDAWVAEEGERVVGLLVLRLREDHVLLENVAVDPGARKLGIGARLLRFAEERAKAVGVADVRLYTNVAMTENLAYYPQRGYRETHRAIHDGYQRVFFAKTVGSRPGGRAP